LISSVRFSATGVRLRDTLVEYPSLPYQMVGYRRRPRT
jgi:hypothetical protein